MKIRNDFVSNSSSSSYIITTKESVDSLIDFIVKNAHSKREDGSEYWCDYFDEENREFLRLRLENPYVKLVIGDFNIFGKTPKADFMEQEEENVKKHLDFSNIIVDKAVVSRFVNNNQVQLTFDDIKTGNYPDVVKYSGFEVFEITKESIAFTRWLVSNCDSDDDPRWKALSEFYDNEIPESFKTGEKDISQELKDKWKMLSDACNGMMFVPNFEKQVKVSDNKWKNEVYSVTKLLDKYEKALNDGNRIFRLCIGYSGEGTDWSSYIWTDNAKFYNDKTFKFEYDWFW